MDVDARLLTRLRAHRDSHALHYRPDDNSDHGPMAWLALAGLGARMEDIERHARRYVQRLDPLQPPRESIDERGYASMLGERRAYPALLAFFDREIEAHGIDATLGRRLPGLLSGWVRDAYHALIRLGYGVEFGIASEVAAGLAYLATLGPDRRLAHAATSSSSEAVAEDPLAVARAKYDPRFGAGAFAERYARVVESGVIAACMPLPTSDSRRACETALNVFDATHGFFALHLVTSTHAMRVCAPFAGEAMERLTWAGLIAGYLCIGAPEPRHDDRPRVATPDLALRDPEHLIKLAWSCRSQSRAWQEPAFERVAEGYLDGIAPLSLAR